MPCESDNCAITKSRVNRVSRLEFPWLSTRTITAKEPALLGSIWHVTNVSVTDRTAQLLLPIETVTLAKKRLIMWIILKNQVLKHFDRFRILSQLLKELH